MNVNTAAKSGRFGDNFLGHLSKGERVIPPKEMFPENVNEQINDSMEALGLNPSRYEVGSETNSINPVTGQPEFFFGKLFKSAGDLLGIDTPAEKHAKRGKRETLAALYGPGGVPEGPFEMSMGSYADPFVNAFYGPGGAGYSFTQPIQNMFDAGLGQAQTVSDLFSQQITPDFFTTGPFMTALMGGVDADIRTASDSAANTFSQLFNTGGMSSATANQMARVGRDLDDFKLARKSKAQQDALAFLAGLQGARGADMSYLGGFGNFGTQGVGTARGLSGDLTNIELQKLASALGAMANYRNVKGSQPGFMQSLGDFADAGFSAYSAGTSPTGGFGFSPSTFFENMMDQYSPKRQLDLTDFFVT